MDEEKTFACELVVPDRRAIRKEAVLVVAPARDGQLGVLADRRDLLCALDAGELRIETPTTSESYYVEGGYLEMRTGRMTVCSPVLLAGAEIDPYEALDELDAAQRREVGDDARLAERNQAVRRAAAKVRVAELAREQAARLDRPRRRRRR